MKTSNKFSNHQSNRAFTLIEVLVASSVMVVLVGIVTYIAGSVMDTWNRSSGKLSANAEARLALEFIAQDLETAILRNNGQQWLRVEDTDPTDIGGPYPSDSVNLKLFAPALDRQNGDGICAIGYKLEYQPSYAGGPNTYALYRMVVSPANTLNNYLSSSLDDPATSAQGTLTGITDQADWRDVTITDDANYLAGNIVEFKVLIYDSNQTSLLPNNANVNNEISGNYIFGGSDSNAGTHVPFYADIILTVVTDQGMDLLNNIAQGLVPNTAANANAVTKNGEILIRRVYFKANPI